MADHPVTSGLNKLTAALQASAVSGDTITLAAGTYTFNTFGIMLDHNGLGNAAAFTNLVIQGVDRDTVILDFTNTGGNNCIYGGDAAGVTIKNMTFTGPQGATRGGISNNADYLRDAVGSAYAGWTFDNIKLDNLDLSFFKLGYNSLALGAGLTIKNVVTTANFGGVDSTHLASPIDIKCPNAAVWLTVDNIDCRLNNGFVKRVVYAENLSGANIRNIKGYGLWGGAVRLLSNASGNANISVANVYLDNAWDGATLTGRHAAGVAEPGVYAGNPEESNTKSSRRVDFSNFIIKNNASYGAEFENDAQYCSMIGFRMFNVHGNGVPLAEETQNNVVSDGYIDTVVGAGNPGIALAHTAYNKVSRVTIVNCDWGIRHVDAYKKLDASDWAVRNLHNEVSDCVFVNVTTPYYVETNSLTNSGTDSPAYAGAFINNKVYGTFTSYAQIDAVAKTQAQFAAAFPSTVKGSDTVTTTTFDGTKYPPIVALNILAGNSGGKADLDPEIACLNKMLLLPAPYTKYAHPQALNLLVGS